MIACSCSLDMLGIAIARLRPRWVEQRSFRVPTRRNIDLAQTVPEISF